MNERQTRIVRHARLRFREQYAQVIAAIAEREYQKWLSEHPNATTLEQLGEIYRGAGDVLRRGSVAR